MNKKNINGNKNNLFFNTKKIKIKIIKEKKKVKKKI